MATDRMPQKAQSQLVKVQLYTLLSSLLTPPLLTFGYNRGYFGGALNDK